MNAAKHQELKEVLDCREQQVEEARKFPSHVYPGSALQHRSDLPSQASRLTVQVPLSRGSLLLSSPQSDCRCACALPSLYSQWPDYQK